MQELTDLLRDIIKDGAAQDEALLNLCKKMIERITDLELENKLMQATLGIHQDIMRAQNKGMIAAQDTVRALHLRVKDIEDLIQAMATQTTPNDGSIH